MAEASTRTVERALALLATVCESGGTNLVDSARDCELAPSTALRLLRTLETTGFVAKDESGVYRPGGRIIQLGAQALSNESLVDLTQPTMDAVVAATGESAYLSVRGGHGDTALYLNIVQGTHSVRHASWVGRTVPLDTSAAGHALRGDIPPAEGVRRHRKRRRSRRHRHRVPGAFGGSNRRGTQPRHSELSPHCAGHGTVRPHIGVSRRGGVRPAEPIRQTWPTRRTVMITFDTVSKVYPDGTVAVDGLTLTAPNGKITTLVGPSGCGKTTSMRMINRLIEPSSGTIALDGVDTQSLDRVALRRKIGYVIQNAGLFPHRTVVDNVAALPRCSVAERRKPVRQQWNSSNVSDWMPNSRAGIPGNSPAASSSVSVWRGHSPPIHPSC